MSADLDAEVAASDQRWKETRARIFDGDEAWRLEASCRDSDDPWMWFPPAGQHATKSDPWERARPICHACPVQSECLRYALVNRIDHGMWGGADEHQRKRLVRWLNIPLPPTPVEHGSAITYAKHGCRCLACCHASAMRSLFYRTEGAS